MLCLNKLSMPTTVAFYDQSNSCATFRTQKNPSILAYKNNDGSVNAPKKTLILPRNVETITSTSNPFVKHCVKLRENSSYRHLHGSVLVVGSTPIREILSCCRTWPDGSIVSCLLVLESSTIPVEITDYCVQVIRVSPAVIRKISGVQSVDSVDTIALMKIPSTFHNISNEVHENHRPTWFPSPHRILVLDGIQDPGNLGTLLRSATAFRWGGVFLLPGCCDPFNEKALRACRGACFQIPIVSGRWNHIKALQQEYQMKLFAGHPSTGDEQNRVFTLSKDFADSVSNVPLCLVLGSEGSGLSEYSQNVCELVTISMSGDFESLNVSVAGGIFMYMLQQPDKDVFA